MILGILTREVIISELASRKISCTLRTARRLFCRRQIVESRGTGRLINNTNICHWRMKKIGHVECTLIDCVNRMDLRQFTGRRWGGCCAGKPAPCGDARSTTKGYWRENLPVQNGENGRLFPVIIKTSAVNHYWQFIPRATGCHIPMSGKSPLVACWQ